MKILRGKGVCDAVAIGKLWFIRRWSREIVKIETDDPERELRRYESARETALQQLKALYEKALANVGEGEAAIFEIHQMMLEDEDYRDSVTSIIEGERANAEYAVSQTAQSFAAIFSSMEDPYMRERAADVEDISSRLLAILLGEEQGAGVLPESVILAAEDLAPSETAQLDRSKLLGFITTQGSANSHTAILARTMNLPAVVHIGEDLAEYSGRLAAVDGSTGTVYIDPSGDILAELREKQARAEEESAYLRGFREQKTVTADGREFPLYANVGSLDDVEAAVAAGAEGIGLFRSEFLYLERGGYPTEEEQFQVYRTAAERMNGKRVVIRTLDIGADKQAPYFGLPQEDNPAMGFRAVRICLKRPELFKTQLRAIYRASAFGRIAILFPMIISLEEIRRCKEIAAQIRQELEMEGTPFDSGVELGVMVETPAAAVMSDVLAKEVDFFSIGTNDLTQYTLAVDRQNQMLEDFYDSHHPAVLRLMEHTVENAHRAGIWVGICGELGADSSLTSEFVRMGLDELSVSPAAILRLRAQVLQTDSKERRNVAW